MKLFAVELGNRQVKLISEKSTKVLPSYFIDAEEYGNREVFAFAKSESPTSDYISNRDSEFTYVWGPGLDASGKLVTDTIGFSGRYNSLEFKLLADFALAELARDFKESKKGILDVVVVTGVPTEDYDKENVFDQVISALKGVHSATIDGESYAVRVHDVYVLMQPVGTAIDIMVDTKGNIKDGSDVEENYIGVVDIGGGTLLIDAFDHMNLDTKNRAQLEEGAFTLYTAIRNKVHETGYKITDQEVERLLRINSDSQTYVWSPNGREKLDLTDIVMTERKRYTRKVVSSVKSTYKSIARMKRIYVTGGTANLLIKTEFERVIPIAQFVDDSETANARGFYKYGIVNEVTTVGEETAD